MRDAFVNSVCNLAQTDKDLILVSGDLGFGVLCKFWDAYPSQFINAGVSEQNMASVAAGMALEGKKVFIYSIGNFPTLRCLEQIRNDICYHNTSVIIVSVGAGFAYGSQGMSHHATEDIAIMRALPGLTIFSPCDSQETAAAVNTAYEMCSPCYIKLGKGGEPDLHVKEINDCYKAHMLIGGKDTAILATGAIVKEAVDASILLKAKNVNCAVYSFPMIKPMNEAIINELALRYKFLFTLEEGNILGGFGSAVSELVSFCQNRKAIVIRLGIKDSFTSEVGSQEYLRAFNEISAMYIEKEISWRIANE